MIEGKEWNEQGVIWVLEDTFEARGQAIAAVRQSKRDGYDAYSYKIPDDYRDDPFWADKKAIAVYRTKELASALKTEKALIGAAGEHYVAFRLIACGYAVGLAPRGTRSIDLLVANSGTGKSITVQTKTGWKAMYGSAVEPWWKWPVMSRQPPHETFFYAFLDLKSDPSQTPDLFIVPSVEVAPPLLREFRVGSWFVIEDEEDARKYRDRWDLISAALA